MKVSSILATFLALTFITASLASTIQSTDSTNKITPDQLSSSLPSTERGFDKKCKWVWIKVCDKHGCTKKKVFKCFKNSHRAIDEESVAGPVSDDMTEMNDIDTTERTGKKCKWVLIKVCGKHGCTKKKVFKCFKNSHRAIDEESVAGSVNEDMTEMNDIDTTERTGKKCKWVLVKVCGKHGCTKKKVFKCFKNSHRAIDEESVAGPVSDDMSEMNDIDTTERTGKKCVLVWIKICKKHKCIRKQVLKCH